MDVQKMISKLRQRLSEYTITEAYIKNNYPKDIVSSINIALHLFEIAERNHSKVRKEDQFWFQGIAQVSRLFDDPQWEDIPILYEEFTSIVIKEYFK